ncbi:MAG: hypothetical protein ACOX8E_10700 [Ruminococcus sp.]|jgi:hypothetical protein
MRKYKSKSREELEAVVCNNCGRELQAVKGLIREGVCHIDISWGYFSEMDGEDHSFDLCEECYKKWTAAFRIPVEIRERKELL